MGSVTEVAVPGYALGAELGRGGMGVVYAGTEVASGRAVAVKVVRAGGNPRARRRFVREAAAAAALRHPGIVGVHGHGIHGDLLYLVMDRVEGTDLQRLLDRDGPLPPADAVGLVAQVAEAAGALHRAGVVHCDIKPSNVLVAGRRRALLTDFGVAEAPVSVGLSEDPEWLRTASSRGGGSGGTYAFMAPEQWRGEPVDARTDVYGLGALLHVTLTGRPPYPGVGLPELVYLVTVADRPRRRDPALPAALDAVVARAMARQPADRFADAGRFRAALLAALDGQRPVRLSRSRRRLVALLAAAVLAVGGVTAGAVALWPHRPATRVVCARDLTLRTEPAGRTVTATLYRGERARVTGSARAGRWVLVETGDGRRGWAVAQYLAEDAC